MQLNLSQLNLIKTLALLTAKRVLRRRITWILMLVGLFPCLLGLFWVVIRLYGESANFLPWAMFKNALSLYFLNFYIPLVALFLGLGVMTDEIDSKNITFTLVRPIGRFGIVIGRLLGHIMVGMVILCVSLSAVYMANMVFQINDLAETLPFLINYMVVTCYGMAGYLAIIAMIGTFQRKAAILTAIIWLVLDNLFSRAYLDVLENISVYYHMLSGSWEVPPLFGLTFSDVRQGPTSLHLFFGLALVAISLVAIGLRLRTREIVLSDGAKN
jgi:ABC-type transport system involved in multi-copper enzyme maturation permease subunit